MIKKAAVKKLAFPYPDYEKVLHDRSNLHHQIWRCEQAIKKNRKLGGETPKMLRARVREFYKTASLTSSVSAGVTAREVEKLAKKIKGNNIIVNNIGFGIDNKIINKKMTYEPFFIANALKKAGKNYRVNAYAFSPNEIRTAQEQRSMCDLICPSGPVNNMKILEQFGKVQMKDGKVSVRIPKEILKKIKFHKLDIITETPSKQADITTMAGCPTVDYTFDILFSHDITMLKNAVDSTKKGGYIIINPLSYESDEKIICRIFGLKKINSTVFQKLIK